jgi:hypothetical protein
MSSILQMEAEVDEIVRLWRNRLLELAGDKPFDFSKWTNYLTMDVITRIAYGHEFGFLRTGADVEGILEALQAGFEVLTVLSMVSIIPKFLFSAPVQKLLPLDGTSGFPLILKVSYFSPVATFHFLI